VCWFGQVLKAWAVITVLQFEDINISKTILFNHGFLWCYNFILESCARSIFAMLISCSRCFDGSMSFW